jgi:hypothetical protein
VIREFFGTVRSNRALLADKWQWLSGTVRHSHYQRGDEMVEWTTIVAAGVLLVAAGMIAGCVATASAVCLPAMAAQYSSVSDLSKEFHGLPMPDLIGGPLSPAVRTQVTSPTGALDFLECLDMEEFDGGPVAASIRAQRALVSDQ